MSRGPDIKYKEIIDWINNGIKETGSIQDFAKSLGWNKDKSYICKQSSPDIAPNGTRRERRFNNGVVNIKEDPIKLIFRELRRIDHVNKMHEIYTNSELEEERMIYDE